ncbi:MAG: DUF362 domain-containing protein [Bacteroidetes bacterium]|nr:DUF362 domain-containing protein [Bacteroidota bacterium]MCL5026137.1 DUF362 domain-containing protein [Chloroflexota bacterium]
MDKPRVAVARVEGGDIKGTTKRAIQMAGGWDEALRGARRVLIKPNLTVPSVPGSAVCTDIGVTEGVIELLQEAGVRQITVAEGPGDDPERKVFRVTGYDSLPARYGVKLLDLNLERTRRVAVPDGRAFDELEIPRVVLDADAVIDIANLKTHSAALATLCSKNLFGVPPTPRYGLGSYPRKEFHQRGIHKVIHDINRVVPIAYCVVDGTLAMEGDGPIKGEPVPMGLVIAGRNRLAVDTVGCHLMRIDPREVDHLVYMAEAGMGPIDLSAIDLAGVSLESVARAFKRPTRKNA